MAYVLEPISIGKVELKNRIVFPSMCVFFCDAEGYINDAMLEYVRERARGGAGLLVIPGSPHGKVGPGRPALSHNGYIPGWKALADVAHENGAKLFCQLHPAKFQAGRGVSVEDINEFTTDDIRRLVDSYAECALRARRAGVDGVEIHGAHAHEVAQFLSPFYNRRTDAFGGSVEKRAQFGVKIVEGIKRKTGADYPLIFRISGDEMVDGGRRIDETAEIARLLEQAGADAIHVSCGMPESEYAISAPMDIEAMFNVDNAAKVKEAVSIPVIAVNRIVDMEQADEVIRSGKADLVSMARAQLADPDIVAKYEGRASGPVRHCIGCNQGCRDAARYKKIRCMQNARLGFEAVLNFVPATEEEKKQKILIAGAGPAGLEAAYDLSLRGFRPVVCEQEDRAGGLINLAKLPPHKKSMQEITNFRVDALKQAGIEIRYRTRVTPELLEREKPDVLIVATGSAAAVPPIPGVDGDRVVTGDELLAGRRTLRGEHFVVLGGGLVGCEAADYLAQNGSRVEIVEMTDKLAADLNQSRRHFLLKSLSEHGVAAHLLTRVREIALPDVRVDAQDYGFTIQNVDGVVVAAGRKSVNELSEQARRVLPGARIYVIGDADQPGVALDAIQQGARAAARV
ncbi:FAD-dependent oxidoreductase [uncultured Anaerotruncus sp.]|uniref:NAD(P)/FAD-dependent oxidoreductase n=1 Tax=uncultured Anaerotruncus sp. TaxID=905011 RepID=UPI00280B352D|nr:FAD-dependent oxidoreductase [uncultured Anaerotruncus sp.]